MSISEKSRSMPKEGQERRKRIPEAGDPAISARAWLADRAANNARTAVALWFGLLVVLLMVATFELCPPPGHQLAAAMLWLTAIGIVAAWLAPHLVASEYVRKGVQGSRRRLVRPAGRAS